MEDQEFRTKQLQDERLDTGEMLAELGKAVCNYAFSALAASGLAIAGVPYGRVATNARKERQLAIAQLESHANDPWQHRREA